MWWCDLDGCWRLWSRKAVGFGGQGYVTDVVAEGSKRRLMVQRSSLDWYNQDRRVNGRMYIRH